MIFDSLTNGSPAPESSCRKENALAGIMELNGDGNKGKIVRRRRIELWRVKSLSKEKSAGDQGNISGEDAYFKKRRSGHKKNDSEGVTCRSHGSISVMGRRREMEDAVNVDLGFLRKALKNYDFFGVYDGHGGNLVAHACREMLHRLLVEIVGEESEEEIDWEKVMVAGFNKMDEEVNKIGAAVATMGTTAVVAVVGEEVVVVANCGDSRAVLSRGGVAVQLSDDHKPDRSDELARIEASGGKVINWNGQRVLGVLATSRSIGDHYLKPFVISQPEVRVFNRTNMDEFLILASDGLWDVVSNDFACQVAKRCLDGQLRRRSQVNMNIENIEGVRFDEPLRRSRAADAAAVLAELAIARGSRDNISVIVVELRKKTYTTSR
ncbi:putative protein phosphatase 2C 24 [Abeliophyllum distichum]|uniref:protein-serine/threonine phosphatase n=1 Tax=Abeliophyllum distichum TaxID=126358 RepID=A0ABD1UQT7_9LAMI